MAETKTSIAYVVGDLVMLRSGGAVMTVDRYEMGGIDCVWHDDVGVPHREVYREGTLEAFKPEKGVTYALDPEL